MTLYRVLIRVVRVERTHLKITIPAWNTHSCFRVPRKLFPTFKWARGYRFHAYANLGAQKVSELSISAPFEEGSTYAPTWKQLKDMGAITLTGDPKMVARMLKEKR